MDLSGSILLVLGVVAILSSIGVLLSRDNLYASLYMAVTMILIATMYAALNLQPVFILITFIFVGAIGMVTVAIASTYRVSEKKISVNIAWAIPVILVIGVIGYTMFTFSSGSLKSLDFGNTLITFPSDYSLLVVFLVSLMTLLMLSAISVYRRSGT